MSNISSKTHMISFRLSNEAYDKISIALATPSNPNSSVSDYCKSVVERHAFRHDKRKYRDERFRLQKDGEREEQGKCLL